MAGSGSRCSRNPATARGLRKGLGALRLLARQLISQSTPAGRPSAGNLLERDRRTDPDEQIPRRAVLDGDAAKDDAELARPERGRFRCYARVASRPGSPRPQLPRSSRARRPYRPERTRPLDQPAGAAARFRGLCLACGNPKKSTPETPRLGRRSRRALRAGSSIPEPFRVPPGTPMPGRASQPGLLVDGAPPHPSTEVNGQRRVTPCAP